MDPATELATLAASYLWALRDLFPAAVHVGDVPLKDVAKRLAPPTGHIDFALVTRLFDIASRDVDERWPRQSKAQLSGIKAAVEIPGRLWNQAFPASQDLEVRQLKKNRKKENVLWQLRPWTLTEADYVSIAETQLNVFIHHAKFLHGRFKDVLLRGSEDWQAVTRDTLMRAVHDELLQSPGSLLPLARKLDYMPVLLRAFDTGGLLDDSDEFTRTAERLLEDEQYPRALIAHCQKTNVALPFPLVLHAELDEIERSRACRNRDAVPDPNAEAREADALHATAHQRAFQSNLLGVAFSGGGIRSATFNLGVLQGLATKGWLPRIDYLSTVSGGGYIGAWLAAWIKRRGSVTSVQESLCDHSLPRLRGSPTTPPVTARAANTADPAAEHVRPIRLLREYSNYLTPQVGAFSADTWTMISTWVRNTALNLLVLTLFLMAALIAPRLVGVVYLLANAWWCYLAAAACLSVTSWWIGKNMRTFADDTGTRRGDTGLVIVLSIVAPTMVAGLFASQALWFARYDGRGPLEVFVAAWALFSSCLLITAVSSHSHRRRQLTRLLVPTDAPASTVWCLAGGAAGGALVTAVYQLAAPFLLLETRRGIWLDLAFGPAVMLIIFGVVISLYLGLEGRYLQDERREWWSRLGAWLGLVAATWAAIATISYFAPYGVAVATIQASTLTLGWGAVTGLGAWLGSSGKSNGINLRFDRNILTSTLIKASPFLFVLGFLVLIAVATHAVMIYAPRWIYAREGYTVLAPLPFSAQRYVDTYWAFMDPSSIWPWILFAVLLILALLIAWRVDVNEFSMHHFYKNRLVRAYLGASRSRLHRRPNAFTGLDMEDDIPLKRFVNDDPSSVADNRSDCRASYCGPFPLINTTLNMTAGDDLAYQERKAQSFVFTPLFCGYDFAAKQTLLSRNLSAQFGFRPTTQFADGADGLRRKALPVGIGTAVAISGAAANPNAGYHTSPAVAFLLTIFNARLGWWIGNPRFDRWRSTSPTTGLFYLLSELFGFSGVDREYVNLSDGGHFDNMGLYELIRRRCRFIVVCDAEQDDRYSFNGLANAIRRCRVDFGVVIDLSTDLIAQRKNGSSTCHTAVGTISYPDQTEPGCIVYVKASVTGDEPIDVMEYRKRHEEFPHQTTGDQFFDESQFESYRALGQHIVDCSFPSWPDTPSEQHLAEAGLDEKRYGELLDGLMRSVSCGPEAWQEVG
jgi:hypothetical protein